MDTFVMAFEQTPKKSRCLIFDKKAHVISLAEREISSIQPQDGWIEYDANEIWNSQLIAAQEALRQANLRSENIAAIGISSQRETIVVWDVSTGEPIYNAIDGDDVRCGHPVPAHKLRWLLQNVPDAGARAQAGKLKFGTVGTWLIWKLTNGAAHVADSSNAVRTGLCNVVKSEWNNELLERFSVPAGMMPEIFLSSHPYGESSPEHFEGSIPITGLGGLQHTTFFGQTCYDLPALIAILDKTCNVIMHTGTSPVFSRNGLCTTVSYGISGRPKYALEGNAFAGASCHEVLTTEQCDYIAESVRDIVCAMRADIGSDPEPIKVSGPLSQSDILLQKIANTTRLPVYRPVTADVTALGAAYLAGVNVGYWTGRPDILPNWKVERIFEPQTSS